MVYLKLLAFIKGGLSTQSWSICAADLGVAARCGLCSLVMCAGIAIPPCGGENRLREVNAFAQNHTAKCLDFLEPEPVTRLSLCSGSQATCLQAGQLEARGCILGCGNQEDLEEAK
jgi:hypothetical protein